MGFWQPVGTSKSIISTNPNWGGDISRVEFVRVIGVTLLDLCGPMMQFRKDHLHFVCQTQCQGKVQHNQFGISSCQRSDSEDVATHSAPGVNLGRIPNQTHREIPTRNTETMPLDMRRSRTFKSGTAAMSERYCT